MKDKDIKEQTQEADGSSMAAVDPEDWVAEALGQKGTITRTEEQEEMLF